MRFDKAISFCLFNDIPKYSVGMKRNAELAPKVYPDWSVVIFHNGTVPRELMEELMDLGCVFIDRSEADEAPMFSRFLINDLADRWIVRDTDCRLNGREVVAVNEWIKSGMKYHVMRDDIAHKRPIQGAMWGGYKTGLNMEEELRVFGKADNGAWGADEDFLCDVLWPRIKDDAFVHDLFDNPIPCDRKEMRYVGLAFNEHEEVI